MVYRVSIDSLIPNFTNKSHQHFLYLFKCNSLFILYFNIIIVIKLQVKNEHNYDVENN